MLPVNKIKEIIKEGIERELYLLKNNENAIPSIFSIAYHFLGYDIKNIDRISENLLRAYYKIIIKAEKEKIEMLKKYADPNGRVIVHTAIDLSKVDGHTLKVVKNA